MRVVFAGTPAFAASALQSLSDAGHTMVCVLTQPDRPAGRGMKLQASPVKQLALQLGLPVLQPEKLRSGEQAQQTLDYLMNPDGAGRPDVMVVAAYGLILPKSVLDLPLHGCLNIHASLLPRWRGAAPIHRAIEAGDLQTGITIMQMDEGLDTGDMLRMAAIDIATDTTGQLHDRLAALGAAEIVAALSDLQAGRLTRTRQPEIGVTYANKINREESRIDWTQTATQVRNRAAAFDPQPGSVTRLPLECLDSASDNPDLKLFDARVVEVKNDSQSRMPVPGTVLAVTSDGITVVCGGRDARAENGTSPASSSQAVCFASAQRPGGRRMLAHQALASVTLKPGMQLGGNTPA